MASKKIPLTIELVPQGQWGSNLRSELPKSEWDSLRGLTYANAGHRCEVCGGKGSRWPVECHEKWEYDNKNKVQRLIGLIALCPSCHEVKHIGRTMAVGNGKRAVAHIMRVNGWSESFALSYIENAFEVWEKRSGEDWTLDISWLNLNSQNDDNWTR